MTRLRSSSTSRDLASAYAATAARILSWAVVSALVYRFIGPVAFGLLALARSVISILNYTALGLGPAMVRLFALEVAPTRASSSFMPRIEAPTHPSSTRTPATLALYSNGLAVALFSAVLGMAITGFYAINFTKLHVVPPGRDFQIRMVACLLGLGTVIRLVSEVPGALLQTSGRITQDNAIVASADLLWAAFAVLFLAIYSASLTSVALAFAASSIILATGCALAVEHMTGSLTPRWSLVHRQMLRRILSFGSLVAFSQLADLLYAPVDFILINRFLGPEAVAQYAPAVQIDSALLLLVSGLASILLPHAALAQAAGDLHRVRRNYVRASLVSATLLTCASLVIWLLSPWIFRIWMNDPMSGTQAILPLVLIHTVAGGSSTIGRSILFAVGRARAYAIAALVAGVSNVLLSYFFVTHLKLGLPGIIYGTIIVVIARCVLWMPAYVLWAVRHPHAPIEPQEA